MVQLRQLLLRRVGISVSGAAIRAVAITMGSSFVVALVGLRGRGVLQVVVIARLAIAGGVLKACERRRHVLACRVCIGRRGGGGHGLGKALSQPISVASRGRHGVVDRCHWSFGLRG